jgi:hypothetical protein
MHERTITQAALAIRVAMGEADPQAQRLIAELARHLADCFTWESPQFSYSEFYTAAGLTAAGQPVSEA